MVYTYHALIKGCEVCLKTGYIPLPCKFKPGAGKYEWLAVCFQVAEVLAHLQLRQTSAFLRL